MAPLPPPPLPTTMAGNLPHEAPPAVSNASPSRRFVLPHDDEFEFASTAPSFHQFGSGFVHPFGLPHESFDFTREDVLGLIYKTQTMFHRWQRATSNTTEYHRLTEELLSSCESIEWQVVELEKTLSVVSKDPAYYGLDEVELSGKWEWTGSARNQVGLVRSALEKGRRKLPMLTHQDLMVTNRTRQQDDERNELSASVQRIGGGQAIHDELSGQDRLPNQHDDSAENNHPCVPLDETATIEAMEIVSSSALTMIAALSTYSAETVAPLASRRVTQEVLLISPYVCIPVALIGVILSFCASKSNGLAECASAAVLLVCLSCIGLEASSVAIMIHPAPYVLLWNYLLGIALIGSWGWLFTYPRCLKFYMRRFYWECFDRRRSTDPWRAAYADPGYR